MRTPALVLVALSLVLMPGPAQDATGRIPLKVLYAGVAGAPRTAEFQEFLGSAFAEAGTIPLADLSVATAKAWDVVIVDSPSPYQDKGFKMPASAELGLDFRKPVILMGAAGGAVLGKLDIKLDWL